MTAPPSQDTSPDAVRVARGFDGWLTFPQLRSLVTDLAKIDRAAASGASAARWLAYPALVPTLAGIGYWFLRRLSTHSRAAENAPEVLAFLRRARPLEPAIAAGTCLGVVVVVLLYARWLYHRERDIPDAVAKSLAPGLDPLTELAQPEVPILVHLDLRGRAGATTIDPPAGCLAAFFRAQPHRRRNSWFTAEIPLQDGRILGVSLTAEYERKRIVKKKSGRRSTVSINHWQTDWLRAELRDSSGAFLGEAWRDQGWYGTYLVEDQHLPAEAFQGGVAEALAIPAPLSKKSDEGGGSVEAAGQFPLAKTKAIWLGGSEPGSCLHRLITMVLMAGIVGFLLSTLSILGAHRR